MAKKAHKLQTNSTAIGYAFLAPFLLLFLLFTVVPVIIAIGMSFTSYDMVNPPTFAGLSNFKRLLVLDDVFTSSVKNTFIFAIFIGPIGYIVSFLMAWVLGNLKARSFFSMSFYIPSIVSTVAITNVWLYIFSNDRMGLINNLLMNIGIIDEPILWTSNGKYIFIAVIIISVWMSMGNGFLVFLAGLQGLPTEVYESARIDGVKNKWQELWYITLPLMKPQLLFGSINAIVASFGVFDVVYQFAGMPTPNYSAHTIVAHLYDYAFLRFQMGYASAVAVVLFVITFSLGRVCMRVFRSDN